MGDAPKNNTQNLKLKECQAELVEADAICNEAFLLCNPPSTSSG
jgi:hypothetical protein